MTARADSCTTNGKVGDSDLVACVGTGVRVRELSIVAPPNNQPVTVRQMPSGQMFVQTFASKPPVNGAVTFVQAGGTASPMNAQIVPNSGLGAFRHVLLSTLAGTPERAARQAANMPLTTEQNYIDFYGTNGRTARAFILKTGEFWITAIPSAR